MNLLGETGAGALAAPQINVGPPRYRQSMRYLMLMWADADAASGDESDFQVWAEFDTQVKAAGAFVLNGAAHSRRDRRSSRPDRDSGARDRRGGRASAVRRGQAADSGLLHHGSSRHGRRPSMGEQVARLMVALRSASCWSSDLRGPGQGPSLRLLSNPPTSEDGPFSMATGRADPAVMVGNLARHGIHRGRAEPGDLYAASA